MVIGGDFNIILDPGLDGLGGKPNLKVSMKEIGDVSSSFGFKLENIYRIRNPGIKLLSWRLKNPVVQRRLDFWIVANDTQEEIKNEDIIAAMKSYHSAIIFSINGIQPEEYKYDIFFGNLTQV